MAILKYIARFARILLFSHNFGIFTARAINLPSVDNASRREPPLVTASRMGLLEAAALLVTHGADLEARDGQGRTALWHAVREEEDGIVEMLIHAGAKVYYENEDLSCPTQLACKTALLKVLESFLGLRPRLIMSSSTQNTTLAYKILS